MQASVKSREPVAHTQVTTSYLDEAPITEPGNHLVLDGVSWRTYQQILQAFDDRHLRITYDRGTLEIMTFKRRRGQRGLEPDECYWIQYEVLVRGKDSVDLDRDPPPDLVVEIDITHGSLDRFAIYAAFGCANKLPTTGVNKTNGASGIQGVDKQIFRAGREPTGRGQPGGPPSRARKLFTSP